MPTGTVLVTGASTGIGEASVLRLREIGFCPIAAAAKIRGRMAKVVPDRVMDRLIGRRWAAKRGLPFALDALAVGRGI
jgi:NAD(P)-dependent dehydrogenase (short-subunit alcohol dehydrogenase family)